jgi:DNA-binding NarL/FixJ family response regulator
MSQLDALQIKRDICVAVVDDHDAIRMGFKGACIEAGLNLCGSAGTVTELLETRDISNCDVVVLDLSLADGSQVEDNVQRIIKAGPQVVLFSIADKQALIRAALKAGAATIVPKSHSMDELISAIRLVAEGVYVNNLQTTAAIDGDQEFKQADLSPREREVLSLYAAGLALKQVANALDIKLSTAKEHIDRVRSKYSSVGRVASTKTDLLLRAIEDGIIDEGSL